MRLAKTLPWLALAASLAAAPAGCKDKGGTPRTESASSKRTANTSTKDSDGTPARKPGGDGHGWRWEGKRDRCFFLAGKECFETREAACRDAGCAPDACLASSGVPARVTCK